MAARLEVLTERDANGNIRKLASFAMATESMSVKSAWWSGQGGVTARATFETLQRASIMLGAAGIDKVRIETRPLYAMVGDAAVESTMARELYRADRSTEPLAVIGMRAEYAQEPAKLMLALLKGMTGESDPNVQTCGILDNGGTLFAQAASAREIDMGRGSVARVHPFVRLNNNKRSDGLGASIIDIVCWNTLGTATQDAESMGLLFDKPGKRSATYETRIKRYAKAFGAILGAPVSFQRGQGCSRAGNLGHTKHRRA